MRYVKYAIVTVLFASLISIAPSISYSQLVETTVEVDKSSYSIGETVSIGGIVPKVVDGVPVVIQVFNPRNVLYSIDQVMPVVSDGSYSSIANIGGKLGITGTYTVKVVFAGQRAETTFELVPSTSISVSIAKLTTVKFENNVFNVETSLSNGSVKYIDVDPDFASVTLTVNTDPIVDGELNIVLPRKLIDSKINNDDDEFIILINGEEGDYKEQDTTSAERELTIKVPAATEEIEIVGTQVIPEFCIIAALVLAAALSTIIVASRKNKLINLLPR